MRIFFWHAVLLALARGQEALKSSLDGLSLPERDPALQKLTFDVGDGPKETWVYVEPEVESFYKEVPAPASTKVKPKFKGFSTKFINLSKEPLELYWEASVGGRKHLMRYYKPFEAGGTASFPTHSFFFAPPSSDDIKIRFSIGTYPENIYVYDPYRVEGDEKKTAANLKVLSKEERNKYDEWRKTLSFNEQYKAKTGRSYLANYLRDPPMHFQWPADHFNQTHWVETRETHFNKLPPADLVKRITDYSSKNRAFKPTDSRILREYREPAKTLNMTLKVLSCAPRVFEIDNFLSPQEVQHIVKIATEMELKESTTGMDGETEKTKLKSRTSFNTWVARETDQVIDSIYRRGADLMRMDEAWLRHRNDGKEYPDHVTKKPLAEHLQLVHYGPGQEYTAHHDFGFSQLTNDLQGTRFGTLLLYLNEGMQGGETTFPRWVNAETFDELYVEPKIGKAILFYSQLPDGNLDDFSHHAAKPVTDGEKWLINLWTWDPLHD